MLVKRKIYNSLMEWKAKDSGRGALLIEMVRDVSGKAILQKNLQKMNINPIF